MRFKSIIKSFIPPILISGIRSLKQMGSQKKEELLYCPICTNKVSKFVRLDDYFFKNLDEYQYVHSIFMGETLNILDYSCPNCFSSDRARLYAIYLKQHFQKNYTNAKTINFLDIAPDRNLASWLKKQYQINYRSVDLFMEDVDDKADLTDLSIYSDNSFDFILCSHVLEHVPEDRKAISELYRILKVGGYGIVMVPILLNLDHDIEDPNFDTPEKRWKYYGQDDHVRMYSKNGFISKLSEAGFKVNNLGIDYFGAETFLKNGIHPRSVLYVVEK